MEPDIKSEEDVKDDLRDVKPEMSTWLGEGCQTFDKFDLGRIMKSGEFLLSRDTQEFEVGYIFFLNIYQVKITRFKENGGGEEYQVIGNFIQPWKNI